MLPSVGISDIAPYIPQKKILIDDLVRQRGNDDPRQLHKFLHAARATEQRSIRLNTITEDTVTMATQAIYALLQHADNRQYIAALRNFAAGTETGVDNSKALSAYIVGALQSAGIALPKTCSTFQVQHACAGGTIAIYAICSLLAISTANHECGITVCSDIAHYHTNSTAEITQGAGAVAMLLTQNPKLIALDIQRLGHATKDVDDFFRPLGSKSAIVNGNYSIQCYNQALRIALEDYAIRHNSTPKQILNEVDYIALHTPFKSMARRALHNTLAAYTDWSPQQIKAYIVQRGILDAIEAVQAVGNIYSGSVYFVLFALLYYQFQAIGEKIVGKKILIGSYGSGYTMTIIGGTVSASAPSIIKRWDMHKILNDHSPLSYSDYQQWMETPYAINAADLPAVDLSTIPTKRFYLNTIREDGYREYRFKA